jgi:hypothetical protein
VTAHQSPIFVVGTPRSGTTLTAKILGNHTNIFMPGETHFFDDIYSQKRQYKDVGVNALPEIARRLHALYGRYNEPEDQKRIQRLFPEPLDLTRALQGCEDFSQIFARFMNLQMALFSKRRWGNNVPRDLFNYRDIRELFPGAKFVICIRDVRGFLLSYKRKWKVTAAGQIERLKKLYHPVVTSYLWKSSLRQAYHLLDDVPAGDRVIVRYEHLVSQPEMVVPSICETLEEEFEPSMLDIKTHNSSHLRTASGIFSSTADCWRTELSPEEISVGQIVASKELEWAGYKKDNVLPNVISLTRIWLSTPYALWKAIKANKDNRGPLVPYLAKRVNSLYRLSI